MPTEVKAVYRRLSRTLEARRSATPGDQEILRLASYLIVRHQRALEKLAEEGEVCTYTRLNNRGEDVQCEKPNLWLKIAETSEAKILACLSALGMTPMNRSKVKTADQPTDPNVPHPDSPEGIRANIDRLQALVDAERAALGTPETPPAPVEPEIDLSKIDETVVQ